MTAAGDELYERVAASAIGRVCRRPRVEHVLDLELQVVLKLRVKRLLILALVADRLVLGELPGVLGGTSNGLGRVRTESVADWLTFCCKSCSWISRWSLAGSSGRSSIEAGTCGRAEPRAVPWRRCTAAGGRSRAHEAQESALSICRRGIDFRLSEDDARHPVSFPKG